MRAHIPAMIVVLALGALDVALVGSVVGYGANTLAAHPAWFATKRVAAGTLMGADETVLHRNLLQQDRLGLHAWFGHQQVTLRSALEAEELSFTVALAPEAYVLVDYAGTATVAWGVRLSRSAARPSVAYQASRGGRFLTRSPLAVDLGTERPVQVTLRRRAERVALEVDGARVAELPRPPDAPGILSFWGGRREVSVDDVVARGADAAVLLDEGFAHPWTTGVVATATAAVGALTALVLLVALLARAPLRAAWLYAATAQLVLGAMAGTTLLFDHVVWSAGYYAQGVTPAGRRVGGSTADMERWRRRLWAKLPLHAAPQPGPDYPEYAARHGLDPDNDPNDHARYDDVPIYRGGSPEYLTMEALPARATDLAPPGQGVVVLAGGSQTWGAGAARPEDRLAARLHEALARRGSARVVVNLARSGHTAAKQRARLAALQGARVDLVILNVGNNDAVEGFQASLEALVTDALALTPRVLLALEPNSPEAGQAAGEGDLSAKHAVVRDVATARGLPWVDLHGALGAPPWVDSGVLWWDFVHLTTHGQALAAALLADPAAAMLTHE